MQERIIEIIVHILNEIRNYNRTLQNIDVKKLEKLGFSDTEMNAAFSWLFDKLYFESQKPLLSDIRVSENSHRILHEVEKMAITPEAHGYLIQLRELDIISDIDIELIIEKIMLNNIFPVSAEEIKGIVSSMILERDFHIFGKFDSYNDEVVN